jgi:hypothetical protein
MVISRGARSIKHLYRKLKRLYISNKSFNGQDVVKGTDQRYE